MKILLDENLPKKVKRELGIEHEVLRVQDIGWNGKKNGELMTLMRLNSFDALVTFDKNLPYQQNISRFPIAIIVLEVLDSKYEVVQKLILRLALWEKIPPSSVTRITLE